ncbi:MULTISPECIES: GNAT family N-acetyltransferase [unclassified Halomonas]|uniref:GNAT family N-acetyltransferase n=1 Tax=unclassified Halomonas TaxID=2609666 RepID=UPI00209D2F5B|nr:MULTISPECIES: GNAT family N-acetyltransferase [unclassified Halomonas]MCP1312838.1 GNAT family N-acetyltransferase [Halomonas sp. 707D7]MCP1326779.1 GNAT family N-acetyltransferase [Halomonas sp. 707D4]
MSSLAFTPMTRADFTLFWPDFKAIVEARETYAIDPEIDFESAYALWCLAPRATFAVKDQEGTLLGAYYVKANAQGPGGHVCNCGYMVNATARGKGVARAMCEHSQRIARELDFKAMQFNAVVATNTVALALWQRLGFAIVGTVPAAFHHARHGLVDIHVMHKAL